MWCGNCQTLQPPSSLRVRPDAVSNASLTLELSVEQGQCVTPEVRWYKENDCIVFQGCCPLVIRSPRERIWNANEDATQLRELTGVPVPSTPTVLWSVVPPYIDNILREAAKKVKTMDPSKLPPGVTKLPTGSKFREEITQQKPSSATEGTVNINVSAESKVPKVLKTKQEREGEVKIELFTVSKNQPAITYPVISTKGNKWEDSSSEDSLPTGNAFVQRQMQATNSGLEPREKPGKVFQSDTQEKNTIIVQRQMQATSNALEPREKPSKTFHSDTHDKNTEIVQRQMKAKNNVVEPKEKPRKVCPSIAHEKNKEKVQRKMQVASNALESKEKPAKQSKESTVVAVYSSHVPPLKLQREQQPELQGEQSPEEDAESVSVNISEKASGEIQVDVNKEDVGNGPEVVLKEFPMQYQPENFKTSPMECNPETLRKIYSKCPLCGSQLREKNKLETHLQTEGEYSRAKKLETSLASTQQFEEEHSDKPMSPADEHIVAPSPVMHAKDNISGVDADLTSQIDVEKKEEKTKERDSEQPKIIVDTSNIQEHLVTISTGKISRENKNLSAVTDIQKKKGEAKERDSDQSEMSVTTRNVQDHFKTPVRDRILREDTDFTELVDVRKKKEEEKGRDSDQSKIFVGTSSIQAHPATLTTDQHLRAKQGITPLTVVQEKKEERKGKYSKGSNIIVGTPNICAHPVTLITGAKKAKTAEQKRENYTRKTFADKPSVAVFAVSPLKGKIFLRFKEELRSKCNGSVSRTFSVQ